MKPKSYIIRGAQRAAKFFGYDLTASWKLESQPLVRHLRAVFDAYQIDCVFDVGANQGQYYDLLRDEVGFKGVILSFEPVRKYVDLLKQRAGTEKDWVIFDFALGSAEATETINVTKSPGLNSFLSPINEAQITDTEIVQIKLLDGIFEGVRARYGFNSPYLKIDTQGFDLEVLKGARESIKNFRALQTEVSLMPEYDGMPTYQESLEMFFSAGFEITGMFPVWRDSALRLVEFDCVMVDTAAANQIGQ